MLPAVYVLLADEKDAADLEMARVGEQPHLRADFDAALGIGEPAGHPQETEPQTGMADVVAMQDWVRQANQHMK